MMLEDTGYSVAMSSSIVQVTLIDRLYEENDQEVYDTFLDEGHPSREAMGIHWCGTLDVEISQGGSGSLSLKDHAGSITT